MASSSQIRISNLFTFLKQYQLLKYTLISNLTDEEHFLWLDQLLIVPTHTTDEPCLIIKKTHHLFNTFYSLYDHLKREPETVELLLGDSILYHNTSLQPIHYPLITQSVSLIFDPLIPEFKLYLTQQPPQLSKQIMQNQQDFSQALLIDLFKKYDQQPISPFAFIKQPHLLNTIGYSCCSSIVILNDFHNLCLESTEAQIYTRPVLFLHKRTLNYSIAIDNILKDLHSQDQLPYFLQNMLGLHSHSAIKQPRLDHLPTKEMLEKQFLMGKPANYEQLLIAHYLDQNDAVLVQGPPGTGKTHTIANIVGQLLSEGKKILITSASEKPLSVILNHIPSCLHSFCMSLLGGMENRSSMEKTLEGFHDLRSQLQTIDLPHAIKQLEHSRTEKQRQLDLLKTKLLQLRLAQYSPIQLGHKMYEPCEVMSWLHEHHYSYTTLCDMRVTTFNVITLLKKMPDWQVAVAQSQLLKNSVPHVSHITQTANRTYVLHLKKSHFNSQLLKNYTELNQQRQLLKNKWHTVMVPLGVPKLPNLPKPFEKSCLYYAQTTHHILKWVENVVKPLITQLTTLHLTCQHLADLGQVLTDLDQLIALTQCIEYWQQTPTIYDELSMEVVELQKQLEEEAVQLIFYKAWRHRLEDFSLNNDQVQAIEEWRQLVHKIGAGRGKQTSLMRSEARRIIPTCQNAIPVWIMPLHQVIHYFTPTQNQFDVVIIDEASQADMLGLIPLYMGKKVLIVGDDQQVSPLGVGEKQDELEKLANAYLYDFPNAYLYSGKFSVYDFAHIAGYQPIKLREHFRSVPEIIGYSNQLAYHQEIMPLRAGYSNELGNPLRTVRVSGAQEIDGINEQEAAVIVNLIDECLKQPQYESKSFGVISLRGDKQAAFIEAKLHEKLTPSQYEDHRLLCGSPSHFQGDERDIILLSLVDTPTRKGLLRLVANGSDALYKKKYNVALSRARDQVWVVHSFDPVKHLKSGDIRKGVFEYCSHCANASSIYTTSKESRLSESEHYIFTRLSEAGYDVKNGHTLGYHDIPLVLYGKNHHVGIICEGTRLEDPQLLMKTIDREIQLSRVEWQLVHLPLTLLSQDIEKQIDALTIQLNSYGIYPQKKPNIISLS